MVSELLDEIIAIPPKALLAPLLVLGTISLVTFTTKVLLVLIQTFIWTGKSLDKYKSRTGESWAVVTGATDGIGKEFALQLAKAGFNIALLSRNVEKLRNVASEIETNSNVKTDHFSIDFSNASDADYERLAHFIGRLEHVGILVNNVGVSHEMPVPFAITPVQELKPIININVHGTLRVTQIVLRQQLEQKRGLILTLSSFAGATASPLLAVYSGSKAFLQTWCDALQSEVADQGIDVSCISTYFVVSSMSKIRRPTILIPTPKQFVKSALRKICLPCGALWSGRPSTSTPYWSHSILDLVINAIAWKPYFISYTLSLHKDIRKRALRKKERLAAAAKKE